MNEFTKIRDRILERIETYIADIEFAEEQELTEDEKTIFKSVKEIINEEFEGSVPLPRFIIHEDGKMKQVETADEKIKLTDEEMKKFLKFVIDYKGIPAEDKQRICEDAIRTTDAICRLSETCGVSYCAAKDMVMEIMETLKESKTDTAKWVIAGVSVDCLGYRFKMYKCSNCGHIDLSHRKNKFCPNCGRRME